MAKRASVFSDEWRRCLREHYKYVVRQQDRDTEQTLTPILNRFGFRDEELRQLTIEATMHVDDMPSDYVPDLQPFSATNVDRNEALPKGQQPSFIVHADECTCPSCMDSVLEEGHDDDGQPITSEQ